MNVPGGSACTGGAERLRFSWRFEPSVEALRSGGTLPVFLQAEVVSTSGACTGELAARTYLSVGAAEAN